MKNPVDQLPQSGPARLIARLAEDPAGHACYARVPDNSPFRGIGDGQDRVPALLAIEMAAQAAAVLEPRSEQAPPGKGSPRLLVGMRAVRLFAAELDANAEHLCRVTPLTSAPPLRIYSFEVCAPSGAPVAEGELSTYFDGAPAE